MFAVMCKNCFIDKLQRFLLLFSALFILFVVMTSSSISEVYPKIFFATALLIIGINPKKWLQKKVIIQKAQPLLQCTKHSPPTKEIEEIEIEKKEEKTAPPMGFLTQDKMIFLKSLLKLRSAEIAGIYQTIHDFQEKATKESWISLFIEEQAVKRMKDEEKAEDNAASLCEKNYQFDPEKSIDSYEDPLTSLHVALIFWNKGPDLIIQRLEEFLAFGFLEEKIHALINEYQQIQLISNQGSFRSIYAKSNAKQFKLCLDEITKQWNELCRMLKISILLTKVKEDTDNEQKSKIDLYLQEISTLDHLQSNLFIAMFLKNKKEAGKASFPDKEQEEFFFRHLKYNPIWYHYFCH